MRTTTALKKAAEDAEVEFISGYLGYLASDFIKEFPKITQSINEKTAVAMAHIHSYLGKRSLIIMKNAGLNDAALPFRNSCDLGTNAGMVIVVTDDQKGKKSENRQDSRIYSDLGKTLLFEPKTPSQLYEMTIEAFKISEDIKLPILIRITNELINKEEKIQQKSLKPKAKRETEKWILHPSTTKEISEKHDKKYEKILEYVETSKFNKITKNGNKALIYSQALSKSITDKSILEIGTFPVPKKKIRKFTEKMETIEVLDDGEDFLEEKISETITDERIKRIPREKATQGNLPSNPKYKKLFHLIKNKNPDIIIGDFGSYTLSEDSPIQYALHYGGAIASAIGAFIAGEKNIYAITGDGGFTHGISAIHEAQRKKAEIKIIIIDNGGISGTEPTNFNLEELAKISGASVKKVKSHNLTEKDLEETKGISILIVEY